ncbi:DNA-binding response regulator [Cupriavidus sp. TMH.W2]|uniref:DNA-binding response regulator n=1 Tax=Cupriavidus sp. TMH.W2 TaxID=3434465 RepID=UPI003D77525A
MPELAFPLLVLVRGAGHEANAGKPGETRLNWTNRGTAAWEQALGRSREAHAVVIDDMPVYRHGVMHLLGRIPGIGRVELVEPGALAARNASLPAPALLVFGMPPDLADGWHLLRLASLMLKPRRLLLVSENMWQRLPPGLDGRFARSLHRSASLSTVERDVCALLELPLPAEAPPGQHAGPAAFRRPFHVLA